MQRDELKKKFEAMESDYVRVLKGQNPNDPKLIPKEKLEDSVAGVNVSNAAPAILVGSAEPA